MATVNKFVEKPDGIQKTSMSTPQEIRSLAPNNDPECQREAKRAADRINTVIELRHEIDDAKLERQRMYTLPTQSKTQSNKENLSLMLTGIAGAAASAIHPMFLVFWFAGFAMYRSSTWNVRERFRSQDKMDDISDEIEEMNERIKKELENLQYSLVDYQKKMLELKP
mmetsp:Transcript_20611/g.17611  ORF Transcript_20611/g.17611 Transcript_20611/m.17611 type:complete len:168 (-) Transcript_20611:31-534(-)